MGRAASLHPDTASGSDEHTFEDLTFARDLLTGKATLNKRPSHGRQNLTTQDSHRNRTQQEQAGKSYNRQKQFLGDDDKSAMSTIFGTTQYAVEGKENGRSRVANNQALSYDQSSQPESEHQTPHSSAYEDKNNSSSSSSSNSSGYVRKTGMSNGSSGTAACVPASSSSAHDEPILDRSILWRTTAQQQMHQSASAAKESDLGILQPRWHGRKSSMANAGAAMVAGAQGIHGGTSRLCF